MVLQTQRARNKIHAVAYPPVAVGIRVYAVKLDGEPLPERLMVEHEALAISAGAAERAARGRAAGAFRRERTDDCKINAPKAAAGCVRRSQG